jgi:predicted nucleic acid-binding protein
LIVLDASLLIAWLLEDDAAASVPALAEILQNEKLVVPAHWSAEIGNALLINLRRGRLPANRLEMMLDDCAAFDVSIEPASPIDRIASLARLAAAQNLTFYDAAYIQLALERAIPLGTLDKDMRSAAERLGIRVFPA